MEYPHVRMEALIQLSLPETFQQKNSVIDIGGFEFTVNGKSICFDFDATAVAVLNLTEGGKNVTVNFSSGRGPFFNDPHLSENFDFHYLESGIDRHTLTAKFLSNVSEITDFYVGVEIANLEYAPNVKLLEVTLLDENDEYPVNQSVLDCFNAQKQSPALA